MMYDIIYVGHDEEGYDAYREYQELQEQFKSRFPDAEIKDGSDDIHGWRFTVELPDETKREYIKYVIREGLSNLSFNLQFMLHAPDSGGELREIVEEMEAEKANG